MTIRILQGDCREILPSLAYEDIAAVIIDPVWPNCPAGLLEGSERPEELLAEVLPLLPKSVRRLVIVLRSDSDPRFLRAVPSRWPFICMQALSYAVPMYLGRVLGGTEIAYCFGEPPPSKPGMRVILMWSPKAQPNSRPDNGHPCSRSLPHMGFLVKWWSVEGETVLDPFCGSATIPLAAHHMHRNAIGIEVEEEYCTLARERVASDAPLLSALG